MKRSIDNNHDVSFPLDGIGVSQCPYIIVVILRIPKNNLKLFNFIDYLTNFPELLKLQLNEHKPKSKA